MTTDGKVGGNRKTTRILSSDVLKQWWTERAERMGLSVSDMITLEMAAIRDRETKEEGNDSNATTRHDILADNPRRLV